MPRYHHARNIAHNKSHTNNELHNGVIEQSPHNSRNPHRNFHTQIHHIRKASKHCISLVITIHAAKICCFKVFVVRRHSRRLCHSRRMEGGGWEQGSTNTQHYCTEYPQPHTTPGFFWRKGDGVVRVHRSSELTAKHPNAPSTRANDEDRCLLRGVCIFIPRC